jgi:hypothetical protein
MIIALAAAAAQTLSATNYSRACANACAGMAARLGSG